MLNPNDPMAQVQDAPLFVVPRVVEQLRGWRDGPKLADLPGPSASPERERLTSELDRLSGALIAGIERHPTKFWVLKQFQQSLEAVRDTGAEAREHFGTELERIMGILGIDDADGLLSFYLAPP